VSYKPSDSERVSLKRFIKLVSEMKESGFIQSIKDENNSISVSEDEKKHPTYNPAEFEAFLLRFRQVAVLKSEPTYLTKIAKIVGKYGDESTKEFLREMRQVFSLLEGNVADFRMGKDGHSKTANVHEMLHALVNGDLFHGDGRYEDVIAITEDSENWFYIFPILNFFIIPVLRACDALVYLIEKENLNDF